MATALLVLGGLGYAVGWIWLMIVAFSESVPWGVGILLFSPAGFIFAVFNWDEAKIPTIVMAVGLVLEVIGAILSS